VTGYYFITQFVNHRRRFSAARATATLESRDQPEDRLAKVCLQRVIDRFARSRDRGIICERARARLSAIREMERRANEIIKKHRSPGHRAAAATMATRPCLLGLFAPSPSDSLEPWWQTSNANNARCGGGRRRRCPEMRGASSTRQRVSRERRCRRARESLPSRWIWFAVPSLRGWRFGRRPSSCRTRRCSTPPGRPGPGRRLRGPSPPWLGPAAKNKNVSKTFIAWLPTRASATNCGVCVATVQLVWRNNVACVWRSRRNQCLRAMGRSDIYTSKAELFWEEQNDLS